MCYAIRMSPGIMTRLTALCFAATVFTPVAHGQALQDLAVEQQGLGDRSPAGIWGVTLGAGLADRPEYPGSSHYQVRPVPLIAIRYGDRITAGPLGLGVAMIDWQGLRIGPLLGIEAGRRESIDPHLNGLGDIATSFTGGAFISYRVGRFDFYATAREAINNSGSGLDGLVQLNYRQVIVPRKLYLVLGPDMEFGNKEHEETWFGVTPTQSFQSGLPAFSPEGGVNTVGVHANLTYVASQHVIWRGFIDLKDLVGQAANSPIVERSTAHVIGLGAAYHF